MRRFTGKMNGEQYLANASAAKRVVHDLDPETVECRIDEIIGVGNEEPFPSRSAANAAGYNNCEHCIEPMHLVLQRRRLGSRGR